MQMREKEKIAMEKQRESSPRGVCQSAHVWVPESGSSQETEASKMIMNKGNERLYILLSFQSQLREAVDRNFVNLGQHTTLGLDFAMPSIFLLL